MKKPAQIITRFAPSPTGLLHLGHAFSAKTAFDFAHDHDGIFLLRIEDIDPVRCKPEFEESIKQDLKWLGLTWAEPARRQSNHMDDYQAALDKLDDMGLLYPCFCTRKEILQEVAESGYAPHGPEGVLYPGTCKNLSPAEREDRIKSGVPYALRLDMQKALTCISAPLFWQNQSSETTDVENIAATPEILGDVVLARKDIRTSYHLSVCVDDHLQSVSHVIRGQDLYYATHLHCLLQDLLGYARPIYLHHQLLLDEKGEKFSKRNQSVTLKHFRENSFEPKKMFKKAKPMQ